MTAVDRREPAGGEAPRWTALGTLPVLIAIFVGTNALYMLLVAFGNITDFGTNQAFVQHVLAMDTTNFGAAPGSDLAPNVMWRAASNPQLQNTVYVCIIAWEAVAGIVLACAVVMWIIERGTCFTRARAVSTVGLSMMMLLFGGGFIDVGGEWFQMWKSISWNGLDAALRIIVVASVPLILIHLPVASRCREP